jgi:hypothetical protein
LTLLDHVLIRGLDERGVEGGRHPGWGTANRIQPLDGCYLEYIDVVDEEEAAASVFGRWVASAPYGRPFAWAVRTNEIEAVAARLGLEIADGARGDLRWRLAGVAEAAAEPCLPFFIEWAPGTAHPGRGEGGIERLELSGDPARVADWLGPHDLPISVVPGSPRVASLLLKDALS